MRIGHARIDITPHRQPFYLLGYKTELRNRPAKGIHDHIFINALLFEDSDGKRCFLATGDLLELEDVVAADIKQHLAANFKIDQANIIVGVTHDHSSVRDYHRTWEFGRFSQSYYDFFINCFVQAFAKCEASLQQAVAHYGQKLITGFYGSRNHKGQLADNIVSVTTFSSARDAKPFAGIVNMAVHSTILSGLNMELTADLAGNTCKQIQEHWGYFPLMLIGCAGDSSNQFFRKARNFEELATTSRGLGDAISKIQTTTSVNLGLIRNLKLSYEIVNDKTKYDIELHRLIDRMKNGQLAQTGSQSVSELIKKCEHQLQKPQFYDVLTLGFVDIGDLRFMVFPGELASAGASLLRSSTNKTVLIAGYSNGFHYYFLPASEYEESFETIGNPVPAGTFEAIIDQFRYGSHILDVFERARIERQHHVNALPDDGQN
ncbi:alkaline ceramidase [Lacticaseibacillus zeae]|uniref:Alkaline ceramidase n=1 Tax=Lacticaseibacillus zeae TaxID=57037 RepID=A0A5R8LNM8_LACZE|nr:neutral/alkaline non-lysosomal ceramidase N-terminal domain-containing protein [Lacticaseibacillus zeae]TLF38846.1 alkaline ceramidase [Lacticaseibacillus zeae]